MLTLADLDNITSIELWQWDECCTLAGEIVRGDAFHGTSAAEHDAIDDAHVTTGTEADLARDALATLERPTATRYAQKLSLIHI